MSSLLPSPPERLGGRYELVRIVGVGGMGTVHLALSHGELGFVRKVAIKRLRSHATRDAMAMLAEEARVAADLYHPNVVQVFDVGRDERGSIFLVMEWVDGVDLGRLVQTMTRSGERLPWDEAIYIALSTLEALDAAHNRLDPSGEPAPIFHRDVTPSNVLLSLNGEVKLGDFGLARAMDRATLTRPGVLKGKLAYIAPEMIGGVRANVRTDLFSVGVLLWETLAGRRLYDTTNELELFVKVGAARIPSIRTERADAPEALEQIVQTATAKRPEDRFESAAAMADALHAVLASERVSIAPRRFARRVHEIQAKP